MSNLETIKGLLTLLDTEELKSLEQTILGILNYSKSKTFIEDEDLNVFYIILNRNFNNMYPVLNILKKSNNKLYKKTNDSVIYLNTLIKKILELHNKKTGIPVLYNKKLKLIFYGLFISIMEDWLCKRNISISMRSLIYNHDKFNSLLNKQFPGYIKSGMFVPFVFNNKHN